MSVFSPDFGPKPLPPLPHIRSDDIRKRIFTHRSFAARPTHIFEDTPEDPSPDNEVLEHLGDQVLGLVVTELLYHLYPYLRVGPSTKMRALVVGNSTLAIISVKYRLPEQLRLHRAQSITLRASVNVQADVFESYIGGLYQDQGLAAVQDWLRALMRPYVHEAYRIVRGQHGLPPAGTGPNASLPAAPAPAPRRLSNPALPVSPPPSPSLACATIGHLGLFNQRLQQDNRTIEWSFSDSKDQGTKATPVWVAHALVDRECWGTGRGNTKKAAKNEAAKQGLSRIGYTDLPMDA